MPPGILMFAAVLALLLIGVAFLLPAGYGLPGPVYGVIALLSTIPGLIVGWLIYRHYVKRGEVPRLGEGIPSAARAGEEREVVAVPNAERVREEVGSFRRAAGQEPAEPPLGTVPGGREEEEG